MCSFPADADKSGLALGPAEHMERRLQAFLLQRARPILGLASMLCLFIH